MCGNFLEVPNPLHVYLEVRPILHNGLTPRKVWMRWQPLGFGMESPRKAYSQESVDEMVAFGLWTGLDGADGEMLEGCFGHNHVNTFQDLYSFWRVPSVPHRVGELGKRREGHPLGRVHDGSGVDPLVVGGVRSQGRSLEGAFVRDGAHGQAAGDGRTVAGVVHHLLVGFEVHFVVGVMLVGVVLVVLVGVVGMLLLLLLGGRHQIGDGERVVEGIVMLCFEVRLVGEPGVGVMLLG